MYKGRFASVGPYIWSIKITLRGICSIVPVQVRDFSERVMNSEGILEDLLNISCANTHVLS